MNKNQKIAGMVAILIVAGLLFASSPMLVNTSSMALPSVATTTYDVKGATFNHYAGGTQGKTVLRGLPGAELFDQQKYVTAWYGNTKRSEKIGLTGKINVWTQWEKGIYGRYPMVLLNNYYWKIDWVDTAGVTRNLVSDNYYNSKYIEFVTEPGYPQNFNEQKFPVLDYQMQGVTNSWSKYLTGDWWAYSKNSYDTEVNTYTMYPNAITTPTYLFYLKTPLSGYIKADLYVKWADYNSWMGGFLNLVFNYQWSSSWSKVSSDVAYLESGDGQVDVDGYNKVTTDPGTFYADGTNEYYSKYVYKEGTTVKFNLKLGSAGITSPVASDADKSKQWKLDIIKPDGTSYTDTVQGYPKYFTTEGTLESGGTKDVTATWTIPLDAFSYTSDNGWKIKLTNGLMEQSEVKVFVVQDLNVLPSKAVITSPTGGTKFTIGQSIRVYCTASPNPTTQKPIAKFDGWAKYYSATSSSYAFSSSSIPTSGQFTFTPDRVGNIYLMVHAIDSSGNAGGESDVTIISVIEAPKYVGTIVVTDKSTGASIDGATVIFGSYSQSTVNGVARFTVESGNYALTVSKSEYKTYYGGTVSITADATKSVSLESSITPPPTDTDNGSIITPPSEYTITFTVSTDAGKLADATVTLGNQSGTTDVNGTVALQIPAGVYPLKVTATGYHDHEEEMIITSDETKDILMTLNSVTTYDLTITVISLKDKTPIVGAIVDVDGQTAITDTEGIVIVSNLELGEKIITVTKTGYPDVTTSVQLDTSKTIDILMGVKGTPGFESITFIVALGVAMVVLYRRKKK